MIDLDAYLARIGLAPGTHPAIATVHRAHATSIPFENLDPQRGVYVSVAIEDIERKLVRDRRGGYCFEQNLLLKAALEQLGAEVAPMLARVRVGAPYGAERPRTHLVLRVRDRDGAELLADVGFGRGTLLEPVPFAPGGPYELSGWRFRVVTEGEQHVLQAEGSDGWGDEYSFVPEPVPHVDIETSNWFTTSFPRSPFVTGMIVAVNRDDGSRLALSDRDSVTLTEQTPARTTVTAVQRELIPSLLAEHFDLPGWELGPDLRLRPAGAPEPMRS